MKGFTLIELIITLAIFGLLAAIAYPAYQGHVIKAHRSDGQIALFDLNARIERYAAENNSYQDATLDKLHVNPVTPQGFYSLAISQTTANTFSLAAHPIGSQESDDVLCKTLTLNELGQKGQTGSGTLSQCWG